MFFRFVWLFLAALPSKRATGCTKGLPWPAEARDTLQDLMEICDDMAQMGAIPENLATLLKTVETLQPSLP